ncbi:MAG TPA: hypothetical protein VGQ83_31365 [Polyangia bacterium]|jgi:hypothetical protein
MTRYSFLVVLGCLLVAAACSKQPAGSAPPAPAAPAPGVVPAAPSAPVAPPPAPAASQPAAAAPASVPAAAAASQPAAGGRVVDAAGLTLEFFADGRVSLKGKDQWGAPIETTYENVKFLRDAMPVLARTVTPPQAEALRKAVGAPAVPGKPGAAAKAKPAPTKAAPPKPATKAAP